MRGSEWESDFQARSIVNLRAHGLVVLKLDPGTGNIPKGWPDTCILYPGGMTIWAEYKTWGGKVSPEQRRNLVLLAASGHRACFMDPRPTHCSPAPMTPEEIMAYEPPRRRGDTDLPDPS